MHEASKKTALCGILVGLSAAAMFAGGIIPLATFATPALAGIFLLPLGYEYGPRTALLAFFGVGLLSFLIVPDPEVSLIFLFFLGWYPVVKPSLDKLRPRVIQWLVKAALFNLCIFLMYGLILLVFPLSAVVAEFADYTRIFVIGLVLLANVAFIVYDLALVRLRAVYVYRLRPKLFKR